VEDFDAGTLVGAGSFRCDRCGYAIALHESDEPPECPHCHGGRFKRSSLFTENTLAEPWLGSAGERPHWLDDVLASLPEDACHLVVEDGGVRVFELREGWTRIGRSLAADLRLDDPTVSRRHALVHREAGALRILDDRSLNGVFVNGERTEWHELRDGDEIAVGRFRIFLARVGAEPGAEPVPGAAHQKA